MATVVNNTTPERVVESSNNSGLGVVLGILLVILLVIAFAVFGFRGSNSDSADTNISVPKSVDVNVNPGSGAAQ
jgi:hypothetical protein